MKVIATIYKLVSNQIVVITLSFHWGVLFYASTPLASKRV